MKVVKFLAQVDPSKCMGDRLCEKVCPTGAIKMNIVRRASQAGQTGENGSSYTAPCRNACPSHIDVPGYVALIKAGRYVDAYELIRRENPFPAVCGRICTHPCEAVCGRNDHDDPLAIRDLKRYAADYAYEHGMPAKGAGLPKNGKSVGIVGAGPSGLTCGHYLALLGYAVDVYEAHSVAGGVLAYGISEYRLPKKILRREISLIEQAGVTIHLNTEVGKEITFEALKKKHGAVYVATGTQFSTKIGIPGEDLPGVYHGLDFLRDVNLDRKPKMGKKVAVIGGGNTTIDAARVALRLGAGEVTILYRREVSDMPADAREVAEALEEGIQIIPLVAPKRFIGEDRVASIECVRMQRGELDESNRRGTKVIEGTKFTVQADMVIPAVSQYCDLPFVDKDECQMTTWGSFVTDEQTMMTTMEGVFAGGDVVRGSDTAIWAIADGKKAAQEIDRYLGGPGVLFAGKAIAIPEPTPELSWTYQKRVPMEALGSSSRTRSFSEVAKGFDEDQASRESNRCMRCDSLRAQVDATKCVACGKCEDICKEEAVILEDRPEPMIIACDTSDVDPEKIKELCRKANIYPELFVCVCSGTPAKEVAAAILKGARTMEDLALMTGVRSGCNMYCHGPILRLLNAAGVDIPEPKDHTWYKSYLSMWDLPKKIDEKYPVFHIEEDKRVFFKEEVLKKIKM